MGKYLTDYKESNKKLITAALELLYQAMGNEGENNLLSFTQKASTKQNISLQVHIEPKKQKEDG